MNWKFRALRILVYFLGFLILCVMAGSLTSNEKVSNCKKTVSVRMLEALGPDIIPGLSCQYGFAYHYNSHSFMDFTWGAFRQILFYSQLDEKSHKLMYICQLGFGINTTPTYQFFIKAYDCEIVYGEEPGIRQIAMVFIICILMALVMAEPDWFICCDHRAVGTAESYKYPNFKSKSNRALVRIDSRQSSQKGD